MKLAIAACDGRVSQRLDCAQALIVILTEMGRSYDPKVMSIADWPAHGRCVRVAQLGIEELICGAVSKFDEAGSGASGILLVTGVSGPVDKIIEAIHSGHLKANHDYWKE